MSEKGEDHHQHIKFFITLLKSPTGINNVREVGEGGLGFAFYKITLFSTFSTAFDLGHF